MKYIYVSVILLIPMLISSQSMFEIGNKWTYEEVTYSQFMSQHGPQELIVVGDTLIDNVGYQQVSFSSYGCLNTLMELFREEDGKVYRYSAKYNKGLLIYDFNATDMYEVEYDNEESELDTALVIVDSIGWTTFLDGTTVETQFVEYRNASTLYVSFDTFKSVVYKNLGGYYFLPNLGLGLCDTYTFFEGLRCFESEDLVIINTENACDYEYTNFVDAVDDLSFADQIELYPNPSSDQVNVNANNTEATSYIILNSMGVEQLNGRLDGPIDLKGLQAGIYTICLFTSNQKIGSKVLIKI